jgi:hypothetical protein
MNTNPPIVSIVCAIAIIPILFSCSSITGTLSKSDAQKQILKQDKIDDPTGDRLKIIAPFNDFLLPANVAEEEALNYFLHKPENITISLLYQYNYFDIKVRKPRYHGGYAKVDVKQTSKILPFMPENIRNGIVVRNTAKIEISGIATSPDKKDAIVEYFQVYEPNEIGTALRLKSVISYNLATFKKFDDGWRLQEISNNTGTPLWIQNHELYEEMEKLRKAATLDNYQYGFPPVQKTKIKDVSLSEINSLAEADGEDFLKERKEILCGPLSSLINDQTGTVAAALDAESKKVYRRALFLIEHANDELMKQYRYRESYNIDPALYADIEENKFVEPGILSFDRGRILYKMSRFQEAEHEINGFICGCSCMENWGKEDYHDLGFIVAKDQTRYMKRDAQIAKLYLSVAQKKLSDIISKVHTNILSELVVNNKGKKYYFSIISPEAHSLQSKGDKYLTVSVDDSKRPTFMTYLGKFVARSDYESSGTGLFTVSKHEGLTDPNNFSIGVCWTPSSGNINIFEVGNDGLAFIFPGD